MDDKRVKDRADHLAAQEALKALERLCKKVSENKAKQHKLIIKLD